MCEIISTADKIVEKYNTRNPVILAKELDIEVVERDFKRQNGAYNVVLNNDFVFIKQSLDSGFKNIVLMHEIGHCILHRDEAIRKGGFKEFDIFSKQNIVMEREANIFASHILLSDDRMLELVNLGYDAQQISSQLNTNVNLVAIKTDILYCRGYKFNKLEYKNDFLKN